MVALHSITHARRPCIFHFSFPAWAYRSYENYSPPLQLPYIPPLISHESLSEDADVSAGAFFSVLLFGVTPSPDRTLITRRLCRTPRRSRSQIIQLLIFFYTFYSDAFVKRHFNFHSVHILEVIWGFGVLLKDTPAYRKEAPGIRPTTLMINGRCCHIHLMWCVRGSYSMLNTGPFPHMVIMLNHPAKTFV